MTRLCNLLAVLFTASALLASAPAFAAGGNGGSNGDGQNGGNTTQSPPAGATGSGQQTRPACAAGYVPKGDTCVRAAAGVLPDRELYAMGRALALAGYHAEALPILDAVTMRDDSMVLTMQGFTRRKLGRVSEGLALYDRALAVDPNNANTYEYLGEYFVETGQLDRARVALAKIEAICGGTGCEQYEDLAKAIETGVTE